MIDFLCTYVKIFKRDEKTGYTQFAVKTDVADLPRTDYGTVYCSGIIPPYPVNMPLLISGEVHGKSVQVKNCVEQSGSVAATIAFLSGSEFKGIGPATAKAIVDATGENIFEFCKQENAFDVLSQIKGMQEKEAKRLIRKVNKLSALRTLIEYITSIGGSYRNAVEIYKKYGEDSMNKIQNNPYLLRYAKVPYYTCEAIAKGNNMDAPDERRIRGLLEECISKNEKSGNTRITFHELCLLAEKIEKQANMGYTTAPLFLAAGLMDEKYVIVSEEKDVYIYSKNTYGMEKRGAEDIIRLLRAKVDLPVNKKIIEDIEAHIGIKYAKEQIDAFSLLADTGVKILVGGPGTGKTTTLNGLIQYYETINPEGKIALCAPTGSAAKRMREATKRESKTICKLLDIRPFGDYIKCKDEFDQLDYDFIIVDESSMTDLETFFMLLRAVKSGSLILFVGDPEQLESVKSGNILADLINSGIIPTVTLGHCFRQEGNTVLSDNIQKMRNGEVKLTTDESFCLKRLREETDVEDLLYTAMERFYDTKELGKTRVFSPLRNKKYELGCTILNKKLQKKYNKRKAEEGIFYGGVLFLPDDPIVLNKNNYNKGYCNGDTGVICGITCVEGDYEILVNVNGEEILLEDSELDDMELAYITTVHKAQGMECDTAILVLPRAVPVMLTRNILYVAITRAKKRVIILSEQDAVDIALKNIHHKTRKTGLTFKIKKCMAEAA